MYHNRWFVMSSWCMFHKVYFPVIIMLSVLVDFIKRNKTFHQGFILFISTIHTALRMCLRPKYVIMKFFLGKLIIIFYKINCESH